MTVRFKPRLIEFAIPMRISGMEGEMGWGNGYVAISSNHPMYGKSYEECYLEIHGGLTYSNYAKNLNIPKKYNIPDSFWVLGFDTAHYNDTIERWPNEQSILNEAIKLKEQLEKII